MSTPSNRALRRDFETIFGTGTLAGLSDGELLERFAAASSHPGEEAEAAFALLVERHGAGVLRVCRGVLGDRHEAEDAFQATFLVLIRRAGAIRRSESVGAWLLGVAYRVASCARDASRRRRGLERRWLERRQNAGEANNDPRVEEPEPDIDLTAMIHAELGRLPESFRAAVVLCDLENRPVDEVARILGWPVGTVKSRLHRGRLRLRERLIRRGITPGVAAAAVGSATLSSAQGAGPISPALAEATARMMAGAMESGARGVPAAVLALVEGVGGMMLMMRGKMAAAIAAVLLGLAAIGFGAIVGGPRAGDEAKPAVVAPAPAVAKAGPAGGDRLAPAERRRRPRPDDPYRIETITVTGRAADAKGRPVAGAAVYVINTNSTSYGDMPPILATVTTGPDGRYVARDVELPVWKPQPRLSERDGGVILAYQGQPEVEQGQFQVAATAPGFGFTWHRLACYRPGERPPAEAGASGAKVDELEAFYRGEPIAQDLTLGPPASLSGRAVDDLGRPVVGARVRVGVVNANAAGTTRSWFCSRIQPVTEIPYERRAFSGIIAMSDAMLSTRTGPDGTYRIDGLPREAEFLVSIDPGGAYEPFQTRVGTTVMPPRTVFRAVTKLQSSEVRYLGHDAVLDTTFAAPRDVRFTVRSAATGRPVAGATVRAMIDPAGILGTVVHKEGAALEVMRELLYVAGYLNVEDLSLSAETTGFARDLIRSGGFGVTDAQGYATLHLRPGEYGYVVEPAIEDSHLPARGLFHIGEEQVATIGDVKLQPGAVVVLEAHDAATGVGVDGVSFEYESGTSRLRREVRSRPSAIVDHPRTDEEGRLRAIMPPGPRRFVVGDLPPGWKLMGEPVVALGLEAGRETTVRWKLARLEAPSKTSDATTGALFPDELVAAWQRLERRALPGRFRVRHYTVDLDRSRVPIDQLEAFLDANDISKLADPAASLAEQFPAMPDGAWQTYEIIDDGRRRRNTHRFPTLQKVDDVTVANGREVVGTVAANGQVSLYDEGAWQVNVLGLRDICAWPAAANRRSSGAVRRDESGGRLTVEHTAGDLVDRWVLDRRTGFVLARSARPAKPGPVPGGSVVRQYGPKDHGNGVVLPTVHVRLDMSTPEKVGLFIRVIEGVELGYRPSPLDFVVSAPAGAMVVDMRGIKDPSVAGMPHTPSSPVADVVAFADSQRNLEPVLAVGDRAPAIRPDRWREPDDANGPDAPPDLTGKVVLLAFGGIPRKWEMDASNRSTPTVLAELAAAMDRLRGRLKDLAIVELRQGGVPSVPWPDDPVAAFARERGIAHYHPVDRQAGEPGWLGATFRDYGARGWSVLAVIDREGRLAYLGEDLAAALREVETRLAR